MNHRALHPLNFLPLLLTGILSAQNVNVDINLDIEHSVGGVSDFGRERHITVHANVTENDWIGEEAAMDYLIGDLDAYLGRDNGLATFHFSYTDPDPSIPNYPDIDEMDVRSAYYKTEHESKPAYMLQYESKATEMIMGTNPHPTYPTLSWYANGLTQTDPQWQPKNVNTSADWVVEYLDKYFALSQVEDGPQMPKYWEVINEPDMLMMTGQFMVTSQERIWEYHNLVATGVKARLGANAPLIGGMTWGQHDFFLRDGLSRYNSGYLDQYLDTPTQAIHHAMSDSLVDQFRNNDWYQWDIMWKGFLDACGTNMDFYSVHIYNWPRAYGATSGGTKRTGGHVEAMLDMMEWYDLYTNGTRKPIVLSEYGAVGNFSTYPLATPGRFDWENLKPFSAMLMQFLERPDYVIHSMPFTPIKASWGDIDNTPAGRYPYSMMDQDSNDDWVWTEYIKWFELWSDVDGTRIDTKAGDLDIQVDCYIDGDTAYLILNNLEETDRVLNLNFFGENGNTLEEVQIKHLHLVGEQPTLTDTTVPTAPASVTLGAEATMVLAYDYLNPIVIDETSVEHKYMSASLSGSDGSTPHRITSNGGTVTGQVNGVTVPTNGEAMLRICGSFFWTHVSQQDSRNVITVNGFPLDFDSDWRGEDPGRPIFFGVLEVPVPLIYLQTNNTIQCTLLNQNTYTNMSIQVWDMSDEPGRSDPTSQPTNIPVTDVVVSPTSETVNLGSTVSLIAAVSPADATNQFLTWMSDNTSIATVDSNGVVTPVSAGNATITVETVDGGFQDTSTMTVTDISVDVTGVELLPSTLSLFTGNTSSPTATVTPSNASNKSLTWMSNNTGVATVNTSGLITAIAPGTATITVETVDGNFTDTTALTVSDPPTGTPGVIACYLDGTLSDSNMPPADANPNVSAANVVNTAFTSGPVRNNWGASLGSYWITSQHNATNATDLGASATHSAVSSASGYSWTITANPGYQINLSSVSLDFGIAAAAGSQPTDWGYRLFVDIDGAGFTSAGSGEVFDDLAGNTFVQKNSGLFAVAGSTSDGGSVTIKLVDWGKVSANNNQFGTSANTFQNIKVNGTVTSTASPSGDPISINSINYNSNTNTFDIDYNTNSVNGVDIYYSQDVFNWTADVFVSATGINLNISRPALETNKYFILVERGVTPTFGNFPTPPTTDGTPAP